MGLVRVERRVDVALAEITSAGVPGSCCRRLSRAIVESVERPGRRPPASISGSRVGSPTSTTLVSSAAGVIEEASEGPGADHARFVDDEHAASKEEAMGGLVEPVEEARDGVGRDSCGGFDLAPALRTSEAPTTW